MRTSIVHIWPCLEVGVRTMYGDFHLNPKAVSDLEVITFDLTKGHRIFLLCSQV
jgi:hypothetical protein